MQQFLGVDDVSGSVSDLIEKCLAIKADPKASRYAGENKTLTCLYLNSSLRTRLSTEKAARNLEMNIANLDFGSGWNIELLDGSIMDLETVEHVKEAAGVISQYTDLLAIRTAADLDDRETDYQDRVINSFVRHAKVPVINLESAIRHPLQSLADCITIQEQSSRPRPKVVLSWAPCPIPLSQAVPNSFVEWMRAWGEVELVITNPPGMDLDPDFIGDTPVFHDQAKAFAGADFIYAKNWSSYQDYGKVYTQGQNWRITQELMNRTNNGKFMHCLPVRRNVVVDDPVLDCDQSLVMEQAANRTWAAQGVLLEILGELRKE
ncbi:acetylornithine carbamoyltransferase [Lewinellaceae bacterium SD302]|nr:acetylornithine carbamoyltransferase [Lewinellaceae bacterium SD302]